MTITALITAGGVPGADDPLFPFTGGKPKALLSIAGKPLIQWVMDAIEEVDSIERVIIIGLDTGIELKCGKSPVYLPDFGGMLENIEAGAREAIRITPSSSKLLVIASDIPGLTPEALEWFVTQIDETAIDLYYPVIMKESMEEKFPGCGRSYIKTDGMEFCGGDVVVVDTSLFSSDRGIWERFSAARKSNFKLAAIIGFDILLLLLFRRLTFHRLLGTAKKRLKIRGKVLYCPFPELGMDIDKPHQYILLESKLGCRETE